MSVTSWVRSLVPAITAIATFLGLLFSTRPTIGVKITDDVSLSGLGFMIAYASIAVLTGYGVRRFLIDDDRATPALRPGGDGSAAQQDKRTQADQTQYREVLARYVVIAGTAGIGVIALYLLAKLPNDRNWPQSGMAVFTSVLPVFSTWVGTVLAFYFTNESFKQAATSSRELLAANPLTTAADPGDQEPLTRPGTMIPYDRIVRIELTKEAVGTQKAHIVAEKHSLSEIIAQFQLPGIVRVIIFDPNRVPLYVVRHDLMPPAVALTDTLQTYLDVGANRAASSNFALASSRASLNDGRRILLTRNVTDLFVTENGVGGEPTLGWVPDDNLRASNTRPVPPKSPPATS